MIALTRRAHLVVQPHPLASSHVRKLSAPPAEAKSFDQIPGPASYPLVGTLYKYLPLCGEYTFDRLHHTGFKKYCSFGPVVKEEIMPGVNAVWIFRPEDIRGMYKAEGRFPSRRSHLALQKYRLDKPQIYNTGGLLPTNGPDWFRLRSVFQRGLSSPTSVKSFLPAGEEVITEWIDYLHHLSKIPNLDYLPEFSRLFLELTGLTALDIRLNSFSEEQLGPRSRASRLMKAAFTANSCILKTDNGPQLWKHFETPLYKKLRKSLEHMEQVAVDLLFQKVAFFKEKTEDKPATLLESYLSSPELEFRDIVGMASDFLLAGIDTTTYTTCFLLYNLSGNKNAQDKLYEECLSLLPLASSRVTANVLAEAQYARACLKESFRMNPISVGVGRILNEDAEFSGFQVPKGTVVVSQNQISCRLPQYFKSPNQYIPERWIKSDPLYENPDPYLVLPFGHGPRSCIARRLAEQNILTLLIKIFRNFYVEWPNGRLDALSLLVNVPDKPIHLIFKKRPQKV